MIIDEANNGKSNDWLIAMALVEVCDVLDA